MKGVRDWLFSQLVSKSVVSSRPLLGSDSFFGEENVELVDEDQDDGVVQATTIVTPSAPHTSDSGENLENQDDLLLEQVPSGSSPQSQHSSNRGKMDVLTKLEDLQVQFFRLLQRIGQTQNNLLVEKVLYRIHLATLIQVGESDLIKVNLGRGKASAKAAEQEAAGIPESNFTFRILVLGKTGVGKSATINSLFDQAKTDTDAFQPATGRIQEIVGTINGIKVSIIDTPGFSQCSSGNMKRNKKIMVSVKRYIRKSPPDIVLYFERLDVINKNHADYLLMKQISEVFGSAIWFNTILVLTHCSSALPEGPDGYPVSFESYVAHSSEILQQNIHQALSDPRLENPVLLVENHPHCKKNIMGEKVLPNGQVWRSHFLLLCICTKVLGSINALLKFQNCIELGPLANTRLPSLPHLLSSILRPRGMSSPSGVDYDIEAILLSDNEEDEYDDLPSIRILTKSQFEKLSNSQKKEYLDELDYRETLYLKKQLREEYRRRKEVKLLNDRDLVDNDNNGDLQAMPEAEAVLLPDMAVPPSFDSDCFVHRYRCIAVDDQWIVRPVLDPQGWDHDVGFDGINLETAMEMNKNVFTSVTGQVSKDKQVFNIQSECAASYIDSRGSSYTLGLDVQSAGTDRMYTVHSNAKLGSIKHNVPGIGVSLTSIKRNCYYGAKLEDTISVGKRVKFVVSGGRIEGAGQMVYGGSIEATLRGRDYPVRNDHLSLTMTVLSFDKETILGGNVESEFRLSRSMRVSVNANLNTRKMGQICIKASSCEHLQIALISAYTVLRALLCRKEIETL
ncbi:translocase of chloroplast 90, chloroplastic-like [Cucurbita moschata]|uniref:Translocase of chloroplast 90, chloroplastic-like n=1 Tax=Cucurbita moschata TaxID=3662 RepID=A0A6J1FIW3_CUCMO|nr:translocase of chloroplast 90, chloroplastic-like [Cucurbita moschata]XP_022938150.1 translocase of chloroplast 90, chloroplastic-like [Cucurbita moschata]